MRSTIINNLRGRIHEFGATDILDGIYIYERQRKMVGGARILTKEHRRRRDGKQYTDTDCLAY